MNINTTETVKIKRIGWKERRKIMKRENRNKSDRESQNEYKEGRNSKDK